MSTAEQALLREAQSPDRDSAAVALVGLLVSDVDAHPSPRHRAEEWVGGVTGERSEADAATERKMIGGLAALFASSYPRGAAAVMLACGGSVR